MITKDSSEQWCRIFRRISYSLKQRILFCSSKRTFSPKQLQNAPEKDSNLRPFTHQALCEHPKVSAVFLLLIYLLYHNTL